MRITHMTSKHKHQMYALSEQCTPVGLYIGLFKIYILLHQFMYMLKLSVAVPHTLCHNNVYESYICTMSHICVQWVIYVYSESYFALWCHALWWYHLVRSIPPPLRPHLDATDISQSIKNQFCIFIFSRVICFSNVLVPEHTTKDNGRELKMTT